MTMLLSYLIFSLTTLFVPPCKKQKNEGKIRNFFTTTFTNLKLNG